MCLLLFSTRNSSTYHNVYFDSKNNNNSFNKGYYTYTISQTQGSKSSSSFAKTKDANSSDIQKSPFHIVVEPSLCMAFGSCEKLAPKTFVVEKDIMLTLNQRSYQKQQKGKKILIQYLLQLKHVQQKQL